MIKPPITPWTPPIHIDRLAEKKSNERQTSSKVSSGRSSGGSSSSGTTSNIPSFESVFQEMLQHYMPETVEFTPLSEEVLSETIRNWLRPAYEQAIQSRREQTGRINAELDADAWSRGMGQSTYLSDIKDRQFRNESQDVDALESDYASTLAGHLYDAMKEQQKTKIEVDQFNAEQINHAREKAMTSAQALYQSYLSSGSGGRGSGKGAGASGSNGNSLLSQLLQAQPDLPKTSYNSVANALARMTPTERGKLYNRSDPSYLKLRSEILYSLGPEAFNTLQREFPA